MNSTSIHNLNGDKKLSRFQRKLFFFLNYFNNIFPYTNLDKNLLIRNFICNNLENYWHRLDIKSSPSRKLVDLFILNAPWEKIIKELKILNVLDIGCGNGKYANKLLDWSQSNENEFFYTGIDVVEHENWGDISSDNPKLRFKKYPGTNLLQYIPDETNLITSITSLAHIDEDINIFKQIKQFIDMKNSNLLQMHFFPSRACNRLYRNGIRQYTPRNISKITQLFDNSSNIILFNLNGKNAINIHHKYITDPIFNRGIVSQIDKDPTDYDKKLFEAISKDMENPDLNSEPIWYGLVIHSNAKNIVFN